MNKYERMQMVKVLANLFSLRKDIQGFVDERNAEQREAFLVDMNRHFTDVSSTVGKFVERYQKQIIKDLKK